VAGNWKRAEGGGGGCAVEGMGPLESRTEAGWSRLRHAGGGGPGGRGGKRERW